MSIFSYTCIGGFEHNMTLAVCKKMMRGKHRCSLSLSLVSLCPIRASYYKFYFPHAGPANPRVCGTYSDTVSYLQSENFPLLYQPNTDCEYRILRSASDICQVELYFSHFDVASDNAANCDRDYLEIKGAKYCGKRDGQRGEKLHL